MSEKSIEFKINFINKLKLIFSQNLLFTLKILFFYSFLSFYKILKVLFIFNHSIGCITQLRAKKFILSKRLYETTNRPICSKYYLKLL